MFRSHIILARNYSELKRTVKGPILNMIVFLVFIKGAMMLYKLTTIALISLLLLASRVEAYGSYGRNICNQAGFSCLVVQSGENWNNLFPDPISRMIVKKVNRMNTGLSSGMIIAVPENLDSIDLLSVAPFPRRITPIGAKLIKVNLSTLAWGAYTPDGTLVNWGPVSGGKNYCPDVGSGCATVQGNFVIQDRMGPDYVSSKFPIPDGGAPMPYGMHFYNGYALHASAEVPGYNASHGCIRLFYEDAEWLNLNFVSVGSTRVQISN